MKLDVFQKNMRSLIHHGESFQHIHILIFLFCSDGNSTWLVFFFAKKFACVLTRERSLVCKHQQRISRFGDFFCFCFFKFERFLSSYDSSLCSSNILDELFYYWLINYLDFLVPFWCARALVSFLFSGFFVSVASFVTVTAGVSGSWSFSTMTSVTPAAMRPGVR